jgi:two-component system phosphate regulon response regulator PhoB
VNSATTVKTILICEDEDSLRELIRVSLGPGYRLVEAGGYEDAVALARAHRPDLVVLDLMLSGRSGFDLLREFRTEEATAETPVLVLSALSHVEDDTLRAGADRFLAKPFDPERLRALAGEMLDGP